MGKLAHYCSHSFVQLIVIIVLVFSVNGLLFFQCFIIMRLSCSNWFWFLEAIRTALEKQSGVLLPLQAVFDPSFLKLDQHPLTSQLKQLIGYNWVHISVCHVERRLGNFCSVTCAAFVSSVGLSTHYSPCFGLLLSGSSCPALTHTHTHSHTLETGCVQAYARIDGAFVCSVQSWYFEASLCLLLKSRLSAYDLM